MARKYVAPFLTLLGTNWITLFGSSITTVAGVVILGFVVLGLFGLADSPYVAVMVLLVLPGLFVAGLVLIPLGVWFEKRRAGKGPTAEEAGTPYPVIDFNRSRIRRLTAVIGALTIVNLIVVSLLSYEGVHYMDSTEFCGEVCHTVMRAEYAAYQNSSHSRVACVECHIGPGAPWFVRSKLSGMGQVIAVALHTYPTPIPSPVAALRPSQEICENCHWPERFSGDRMRVITHFAENESSTPQKTVLLMHIGGGQRDRGIHSWHVRPNRQTYYYASDSRRQEIAWVKVLEDGQETVFQKEGFELPADAETQVRKMDCIDCHNRPTHVFHLPSEAIEGLLVEGKIDRSIPFIRKVGFEVLTAAGEKWSRPSEVGEALREYYRQNHGEFWNQSQALVEEAARQLETIYDRNVVPEMKLGWGYHPVNIGHNEVADRIFPGCFRCHNGTLQSAEGRTIEQDCASCHSILAEQEENTQILEEWGVE